MSSNCRFDQIIKEGLEEFKDHKAITSGPFEYDKPWHVSWKKDGSSNYYMDIIILRGNLCISGDLGAATYRWEGKISPDFLLGCDFGYFWEKCEASENGCPAVEWSERAAEAWLKAQWEDVVSEFEDDLGKQAIAKELFDDLHNVAHSKFEWQAMLMELNGSHDDPVTKVLGPDAYSESGIWDAGEVPMARCILHWQGMKMAFRQLGYGEKKEAA